jgi:hypothetical protein
MVNRKLFDFQRCHHDAAWALSGRRRVRRTRAFGPRGGSRRRTRDRHGTWTGSSGAGNSGPTPGHSGHDAFARIGERHEGLARRKAVSAVWEGKPLKGKPHRRYRHETRPEGSREEQSVRRLRKPVDAAQPGEASPVWVASRCLKRHRGANLMRGRCFGNSPPWVILWSGTQVHERMCWCFAHSAPGAIGKTSQVGSQDQDQRGRT